MNVNNFSNEYGNRLVLSLFPSNEEINRGMQSEDTVNRQQSSEGLVNESR